MWGLLVSGRKIQLDKWAGCRLRQLHLGIPARKRAPPGEGEGGGGTWQVLGRRSRSLLS